LGLDPEFADFSKLPGLTPALIRQFIGAQLQRLTDLGYEVVSCLVDTGASAAEVTLDALKNRQFDCVLIGAGLREPEHLLLFERLLNIVHTYAPGAKLCFNTTPADSAEAVRRWI
jgi:hypothetical protein